MVGKSKQLNLITCKIANQIILQAPINQCIRFSEGIAKLINRSSISQRAKSISNSSKFLPYPFQNQAFPPIYPTTPKGEKIVDEKMTDIHLRLLLKCFLYFENKQGQTF